MKQYILQDNYLLELQSNTSGTLCLLKNINDVPNLCNYNQYSILVSHRVPIVVSVEITMNHLHYRVTGV